MNARQLIEKLEGFNSETEVLVSSDEEGNNYGKLEWVDGDRGYIVLYPGETVQLPTVPITKEEYQKFIDDLNLKGEQRLKSTSHAK